MQSRGVVQAWRPRSYRGAASRRWKGVRTSPFRGAASPPLAGGVVKERGGPCGFAAGDLVDGCSRFRGLSLRPDCAGRARPGWSTAPDLSWMGISGVVPAGQEGGIASQLSANDPTSNLFEACHPALDGRRRARGPLRLRSQARLSPEDPPGLRDRAEWPILGPRTIGGQPLSAFRSGCAASSWGCAARPHGPAEQTAPLRRRKASGCGDLHGGASGGGSQRGAEPEPSAHCNRDRGDERRRPDFVSRFLKLVSCLPSPVCKVPKENEFLCWELEEPKGPKVFGT